MVRMTQLHSLLRVVDGLTALQNPYLSQDLLSDHLQNCQSVSQDKLQTQEEAAKESSNAGVDLQLMHLVFCAD